MENIIELKNVKKVFKNQIAIENLNITVAKGEIFGLLGPSGSGKTTTIKMLTGQLIASSGEIEVFNLQPNSFTSENFKAKIGILSDNSTLYDRLTVYDNLKLFCKLYGTPLSAIESILQEVNLQGAEKKQVAKLSKGMKQRILLAKALMHKPALLFLDEPTSALDPGNMAQIHRSLKELNDSGTTIFLTTHNMEEATVLCDRVAFLDEGKIKEIGKPKDLRYKYSSHDFVIETFSGDFISLPNTPESAEEISQLIISQQVKTMATDNPTLGDIFLKVTGRELE